MLNTISIFKEATRLISKNWRVLISVLALPVAGSCLLGVLNHSYTNLLFLLATTLVDMAFYVVIAITTHRLVLLGADSVSKWALFKWTKRETCFFICALGLEALPFLGIALSDIWLIPVFIGLLYLVARLSLVFPSIAVGHSASLSRAWQLSENYRWEMILIFVLYPIFLSFSIGLILYALSIEGLIIGVLSDLLYITVMIITITMLSLAYRKITDRHPDI